MKRKWTALFLALSMVCALALPVQAAQGGSLVRAASAAVSAPETTPEAVPAVPAGEGYSDTVGHYAAGVIKTWSGYGVLKGYEDGTFRPDGTITRAELAAVLDRVMGYQDAAENTFADLPAERWYTACLLRLAEQGIFGGDEDKKMNPEAPITRQETFAAMARALALEESQEPAGFADDDTISDWAKGYVSAMKQAGYIEGDRKGNIRAGDPITRAEVVTILNKMAAGFVNADGTYTEDCKGNLFVNAKDVTLKDMTVDGDLIVTDGVADGDVYLDKVTVKGDIILRGCGENSFHILPGTDVKNIIVTKTTKGIIRLVNESGKTIPMIYVNDGKAGVTLDGDKLGDVVIACDAPVTISAKSVKTVSVNKNAKVTVEKGTTVSKMIVGKTAANATVTVSGKVNKLTNGAKIKVDKQGGSVGGSSSSSSSSGGSYTPPATSPSPAPSESPEPVEITEVTLQLLAPSFAAIPDEADVLGTGYTAETKWFNADGSAPSYRWKAADSAEEDTFTADQAYQAVVTLSPVSGYAFADDLKVNVTDGKIPATEFTPAKVKKGGNDWVVTMNYEKTGVYPYVADVEIVAPEYVYAKEPAKLCLSYLDFYLTDPANHTYQWYKCNDDTGTTGKTAIPGATGKDYTVPAGDIQNNKTSYYTAEVTVKGETYTTSDIKMIEVRDYSPITEADIPTPEFGAKIRFEDIPQEDILDCYIKFIDVSKVVDHPDVSYDGSVCAYGTKDGTESGGNWGDWLENSGGSILKNITAEGTGEIINDYSSLNWLADEIYDDPTSVHEYVINRLEVELTPQLEENGNYRDLTEKTGRITYNLDENEQIHYHSIGMEAEVDGEAAEYRPAKDCKLIIDLGSGMAKFVDSDGNNALPERCTYGMLWMPDVNYPQWSGTSYKRERDGWKEYPLYIGADWIQGVQNGKLEAQGREPCIKLELCVPGKIDHHLYVYSVYISADRIIFGGENG